MSLKPTVLIEPQTGAVTVEASFQVAQKYLPATLMATGLAGAETVAVLFSVNGGSTWEPVAQDGSDLELTATANMYAVESPLMLAVTKTATAAASGVYLMYKQPPSDP